MVLDYLILHYLYFLRYLFLALFILKLRLASVSRSQHYLETVGFPMPCVVFVGSGSEVRIF